MQACVLCVRTLDGPASGVDFRYYASLETTLGVEKIASGLLIKRKFRERAREKERERERERVCERERE